MEDIIQQVSRHDRFDRWFIQTSSDWNLSEFVDNGDTRIPLIPLNLLYSGEAKPILEKHISKVMKAETRKERRKAFMSLLRRNKSVKAGKELSDVSVFFNGIDCFDGLSMNDRLEVSSHFFYLFHF